MFGGLGSLRPPVSGLCSGAFGCHFGSQMAHAIPAEMAALTCRQQQKEYQVARWEVLTRAVWFEPAENSRSLCFRLP